ncbi:MAG: TonB-dependent receptor [Gammaproteobacteria bacterium]
MRLPTDLKSRSYLSLAALGVVLAGGVADAKPVAVDLPAQPLADSIHKLADLSGMSVSVESALLTGKTAPAVKGNLEPADALKRLLAGSRLDATVSGDKVTITQSTTRLGTVQVAGESVEDGSEAVGYRVDTVHGLGAWGDVKALDLPYTTFALSEDLLQNSFVSNPFLVERLSPLTGLDEFQIKGQGSFVGFRGIGSSSPLINGLQGSGGTGIFLENVGSVELLSGYSGFLYGVGAGGGLEVYNLKRPIKDAVDITVGHYALGGYHGDADVTHLFGDGLVGVRVNLMSEGGDTAIDNQSSKRHLASVALDFNPTENLRITSDAYYGDSRLDGLRGSFSSFNTPAVVPRLDNSGLWGPKGAYSDVEAHYFGLGLQYQITDSLKTRVAWNHRYSESKLLNSGGSIIWSGTTPVTRNVTTNATASNPSTDAAYAYLDGVFRTFGIEHRMTVGFNGYVNIGHQGIFNNNGVLVTNFTRGGNTPFQWGDEAGIENFAVPDYYAGFQGFRKSGRSHVHNFMIGDTVKFDDQWSVMAGLNRSEVSQRNYNALTGAPTSKYSADATTPTVSLLFKPIQSMTTYATYMQSLDPGTIVGSTYKNANAILPPTKSYEYEFGVKYELPGGALLTAALYRMDIGSTKSDDGTQFGTLTQDGRQVNDGLDLTISGKVTDNLALTGGYAYINAVYKNSNDPKTVGSHPWGVPPHIVKLTADYVTPLLTGLSITGGVYFNGTSPTTTVTTTNLYNGQYKGYAEVDLGARYTTQLNNTRTTYRLNIANLLDKNQWSYGDLNYPRTVSLSATVGF